MTKECRKHGVDEDNTIAVFNFLLDRVKANLHLIVCMSPVGEPFRNRIRMYPALVNCTTIDLFNEWPQEALLEVGEKYLANVELGVNDQVNNIVNYFAYFNLKGIQRKYKLLERSNLLIFIFLNYYHTDAVCAYLL